MRHVVKHGLDKDLAKRATLKAWESYQTRFAKYSPQATWVTNDRADVTFSVKGVTLKGALDIADDSIGLELEVPFLFRPFKKIAVEKIEEEIRKWVDLAARGEL
ncbi:MAG: hypothetical protein GXY23_00060 [Myxococcales bacterium]|jgi:hypothetical protein|nr:hypothetical protein [Myxococcales bacterium]